MAGGILKWNTTDTSFQTVLNCKSSLMEAFAKLSSENDVSREYIIMTWIPGPNTTPLFSEYLLTIVVDRDVDGTLSIVGIADYNVQVTR